MSELPIVILGAGGMGRESAQWARDAFPRRVLLGFLDDSMEMDALTAGIAVIGATDWLETQSAEVVVAIGSPQLRKDAVRRVRGYGASLLTVVHPSSYRGPGVHVGEGSIIGPNVTLARDVTMGIATIVNYGAQIGHDCRLGDYTFIGPGVNLAGGVSIAEGVDVGIGATAIQNVTVGPWTRLGAGAVVVSDIAARVTAVGVPARPLRAIQR